MSVILFLGWEYCRNFFELNLYIGLVFGFGVGIDIDFMIICVGVKFVIVRVVSDVGRFVFR